MSFDLDHLAAEALGHLDDDLRLARLAVRSALPDQLLELADTRLALGLARGWASAGSTRALP